MSSAIPFADPATQKRADESAVFAPKFDKNGLITAVVCDHETNEVLMVAYMSEDSLRKTLEIGEAVFYSRSRQELWHKGQTSGNTQTVKEILVDCDQDCLVLKVVQNGGAACHTGRRSCFYRSVPFGDAAKAHEGADAMPVAEIDSNKLFDPDKVYGEK